MKLFMVFEHLFDLLVILKCIGSKSVLRGSQRIRE